MSEQHRHPRPIRDIHRLSTDLETAVLARLTELEALARQSDGHRLSETFSQLTYVLEKKMFVEEQGVLPAIGTPTLVREELLHHHRWLRETLDRVGIEIQLNVVRRDRLEDFASQVSERMRLMHRLLGLPARPAAVERRWSVPMILRIAL